MNKTQMQMMIKETEKETETRQIYLRRRRTRTTSIIYMNHLVIIIHYNHISIEDINTIKKQIECQSKIIE